MQRREAPPKPEPVPSVMRGSQGQILQPWGPGGSHRTRLIVEKGEDMRDMRDPEEVGWEYLLRDKT